MKLVPQGLGALVWRTWFIPLAVGASITGIHEVGYRPLPTDPHERLAIFEKLRQTDRAYAQCLQLVEAAPLELALHHRLLRLHFELDEEGRDDQAREQAYRDLMQTDQGHDVGAYGLGLMRSFDKDYPGALSFFKQVRNRDQEFLNNSTGWVHLRRGSPELAEPLFLREIEIRGNVRGAVSNLVGLYLQQQRLVDLESLAQDPVTAPHIDHRTQRQLLLASSRTADYLAEGIAANLERFRPVPIALSLLISALWIAYFWRIDVFEQEPLGVLILATMVGATLTMFAFVPYDLFRLWDPRDVGSVGFFILHVGLIEETLKFVGALLVIALSKQANEPVDWIIYGAMSALGFAAIENLGYLTAHGSGIVFVRFVMASVVHVTLTGLLCHAVALGWFHGGALWAAGPAMFAFVVVMHGLYDASPGVVSAGIVILLCGLFARSLRSALRRSAFFDLSRAESRRLMNYRLLVGGAAVLVLTAFLYDHFLFGTEIAVARLVPNAVIFVFPGLALYLGLGRLDLFLRASDA